RGPVGGSAGRHTARQPASFGTPGHSIRPGLAGHHAAQARAGRGRYLARHRGRGRSLYPQLPHHRIQPPGHHRQMTDTMSDNLKLLPESVQDTVRLLQDGLAGGRHVQVVNFHATPSYRRDEYRRQMESLARSYSSMTLSDLDDFFAGRW